MSLYTGHFLGHNTGHKLSTLTKYGGAEASPTSVAELYAHSNPAQAIIDLMSYATLPDYLWLGNIADGAWVDVVSGLSLGKVGTPLFQQADSRFGNADTVQFDHTNDGFIDTVNDGALEIGTGDYQCISIFALNTLGTGYMHSKYDSRGYRNYALVSGYMYHSVAGASGVATASVSVNHGTANPQTNLYTKTATATAIATREGTGTSATATGDADTVSSTALKLGTGPSTAMLANVAVYALWIGTGDLTNTERLALAQGLGLE